MIDRQICTITRYTTLQDPKAWPKARGKPWGRVVESHATQFPDAGSLTLYLVQAWLGVSPDRVVCIHCLAGKGRTGLMVGAALRCLWASSLTLTLTLTLALPLPLTQALTLTLTLSRCVRRCYSWVPSLTLTLTLTLTPGVRGAATHGYLP